MTEMLNKEFSRKSFVKGGGAMVVGFSLAGAGLAGRTNAADSPYASNGPTDQLAVDTFLTIHPDNTASLRSGRVELGQGAGTGLLMIAADELDMDLSQVRSARHDTNVTPNTSETSASTTIKNVGPQVRAAAAYAKQALLGLAATSLGVPVSSLSVSKGVVSGGGRSVAYGELMGDKLFNVRMPSGKLDPGQAPAKSVGQYRLLMTNGPREEIPDKISGKFTYVHNVRVPGMVHGRVVRPRGTWGYGLVPTILSIDEGSIKHIAGARVVRKGNFIGVVAPLEYDAIQAAAQLKVKWATPPVVPGSSGNLFSTMRELDSSGKTSQRYTVDTGNVNTALASAAHVVSATYAWPYNSHAIIGPYAAVADVTPNGARLFTFSEDIYDLRSGVSKILGLPQEKVRITYYEGSSCYGYAPFNDAAKAAAVMSQLAGKPVRLQFMRWDEEGYDLHAPPVMIDLRAGIDSRGNIVAVDHTTFSIPYKNYAVDTTDELLGTPAKAPNVSVFASSSALGAVSTGSSGAYTLPNIRALGKTLPQFENFFMVSYMREPNSLQGTFAWEQMIDELAYAAKLDPIAFRLQNLTTALGDPPRAVLNTVAQASHWQTRVAASSLSDANVVRGRGVAFGAVSSTKSSAAVAEIEVNKKTGKILVKQLHGALDVGLVISPNAVESQMMGEMIQSTSRTLFEEVTTNKTNVTSLDWVTYPILRFKEHPNITAAVVQRTDQAPLKAGSETMAAPTSAAIANAFFDATGVRMRTAPMTPARVRATLKAAGVA
jgi:CO/xanthine dehydrogenase Mo-binding subunit